MLSGRGNTETYAEVPEAQQIRYDYLRTGAAIGGAGEGAWVAGECEMLVVGTAIAPITFSYGPIAGQVPPVFRVQRVVVGLTCLTAPGPVEFGNVGAALANGIIVRISRAAPAETTGLHTITVNPDFMKLGNLAMNDDGVNAYLIGTMDIRVALRVGDTLDMVVQDDLTGFGGVTMWAYVMAHLGH